MASDPALAPAPVLVCSPEARAELVAIVSRAFGIADGYRELNGAIGGAAGFDMFERIGMEGSPMRLIVAELAKAVEGDGTAPVCLQALFVAYPGSFELRGWVAANTPALLALVGDAAFEAARAGYEKDRQERRVRIIVENLNAFGPALRLDPDQLAVSRKMVAKLDDLDAFKAVHDFLHRLQGTVLAELDRNANPAILADDRRDAVSGQIDELALAILDMNDLRDQYATFAAEPERCDKIVQSLREVLNTLSAGEWSDPLTPRRGFMKLREMLRAQMTVFDGLMVESSKDIPFAELAKILRDLAEPPEGPAPAVEKRNKLLTTAEALDATARRLAARREIHQLSQRMDAILHSVEEVLWGTAPNDVLTIYWEEIGMTINGISEIDPRQLDGLIAVAHPIEIAYAARFSGMPDAIKRDFTSFIAKARFLFRAADKALRRDCLELRRLHKPLETLLENQE